MTRIVLAAALTLAGFAVVLGGIVLARPTHVEVEVRGAAMAPTLEDGDVVTVEAGAEPRRDDMVVLDGAAFAGQAPGPRVLRVLGVGGDRLEYADGRLTRNGQPVPGPHATGTSRDEFTVTVPDDTVFLAGDARDDAADPRGAPVAAVEGRVVGVNGTPLDGTQSWLVWVAGGAVVALGGLGWLIVGVHRRTALLVG